MIDVRRLRDDRAGVKAALARRNIDTSDVDRAADLYGRQRELGGRRDGLRGEINALSKRVGAARRQGDDDTSAELSEQSRRLGEELSALETEAGAVDGALRDLLLRIPNIPADDAPTGSSEADNVVLRVEGFDPEGYREHQRVPHWEVGIELGILDLERGAKVSGSMFPLYRGAGATLTRALCQLALDRNADAYEEIGPPTLVRTDTLEATGQLPKFADDAYHLERDDLWAIPTAEVPLTSMRRNEILADDELPVRLMAYSPCYRREAGSAGRDTRGLLRVHEFDKVEILALCRAEEARQLHAELLARAEGTIAALGLPYRIIDICTGDLGQSHARSFDIEVYAPGCDLWLEVSSVSWFSDYQARRANIRYRPTAGGATATCHTVNGSALAVPRVWAAIVETYRQPDGSVALPEVLHPYLRGATAIARR
ncbi:MAG TPA: serine--tRNA ligase [Acidimicrobiales bacterium]|jgi:seryl-tRNA synthetase